MSFEWQDFEIGELCSVTSSKRIFAHDYVDCGVPFYASKDVIDKSFGLFKGSEIYISHKRFSDIADKFGYPSKGDLLLSSVGNRAGIAYVVGDEGKFYFKDGNITWFKNFNSLSSDFLCYWLKSGVGQSALQSIMIGSAQKALTISGLLKLRIKIPSLLEQDRIVAILSALDDRITLLRETNANLEAIAQALFKSWFVDFDPVRAKAEGLEPQAMDAPTAALFPDSFEESEQGLVPKGWALASIGNIADVIDCLHAKKPELVDAGKPFLQLNNIRDDGVLYISGISFVSLSDYQKWTSRIQVEGGDCVITNVGRVGAVSQIPSGFKAAMGRNMTAIRLRPEWPYPTYLIELLQSAWMRAEIVSKTDEGTILSALNVKSIPKLRCVLPSVEVMEIFEDIARPLRASMEENAARIQTLTQLRDTLLPRLISGQLRLPEAEQAVEEALA